MCIQNIGHPHDLDIFLHIQTNFIFNPNVMGVKYYLILSGEGARQTMYLFAYLVHKKGPI